MRSSSSAGLLLLLVAFLGIAGFLTGNLDRWLGVLFSPTPAGTSASATSASSTGQVSLGAATARGTA